MTPDLATYDIILINTSGGKDSMAMMDLVVTAATAVGVRDRLVAVHADLGRVEWPGTKALAAEHAAHYGMRFEVVSREQGDLLHQIEFQRKKFPDSDRRFCTSDQKTSQVAKVITGLVKELRNAAGWVRNPDGIYEKRKVRILNCLGMRAQESPRRSKMVPLSFDPTHWSKPPKKDGTPGKPHGKRHVERWLPIHTWTEPQVWERIAQAGTRVHPAYAAGMPRLSCSFCVLGSTSSLIRAVQLRPKLAAQIAGIEARIGHTFQPNRSMAQIIRLAAETDEPVAVESWAA